MNDSVKVRKEEIRKKILLRRKNITQAQVSLLSAEISKKVLSIKKIKGVQKYLVYLPTGNEVDTKLIIHFLIQNNKKIYLTAFFKNDWLVSEFYSLDDLEKNQFNIYQPKKIVKANIADVDLAFIPGVAFSKRGNRIGFGKGVYDKLLANFKGLKIGLAYEFQILNDLPMDAHDLKMDLIFSEKRILDFRAI